MASSEKKTNNTTAQKKKTPQTKKTVTQKKPVASKKTSSAKTRPKDTKEMAKAHKIKYELKMIGLVFFTLLSFAGLYTDVVGIVGDVFKIIYLGLFSYLGYLLPLFIFFFTFINLNPNLKPARKRINIALSLLAVASILISTMLIYNGVARDKLMLQAAPFALEQLKLYFTTGLTHESGGLVGTVVTLAILKLIGPVGAYLLIFASLISGFIIWTRISLQELWEMRREEMALKKEEQKIIKDAIRQEQEENNAMSSNMAKNKKQKQTHVEGNEPHFLSKLDAMRKVSRQKSIKNFDYDTFEALENQIKEPTSVEQTASVEESVLNQNDEKDVVTPLNDATLEAQTVDNEQEVIGETAKTDLEKPTDSKGQSGITFYDAAKKHEASTSKQAEPPKKIKESDIEPQTHQEVNDAIRSSQEKKYEHYQLPPMSLLNESEISKDADDKSEYIEKAKLLEETLNNFNVDAKVISVKKGPSITMFEVQPSPGVKVSKIVGLSDDIALNLATSQVRIAPIPGKAAIGIEIPNKKTSMVTIKEVLSTPEFNQQASKITIGLGKDISGNPIIGDLASMPHLLIAGATGSGKSVCINTIISSILFRATPDEVKFLMIDPKVVELSNYNGIPHLILPVVTDPKKASIALSWAVNEMTRRYKLFAETSVRDMKSYNAKVKDTEMESLAQIVVIIDELADLMMVAPNQVEDAICRLAQMARAAGIHLIVATQRPSVDVITGLIKANIPSRIAFSVSSSIDSRTIIDMGGAEKLLGKGDMLFYPVGASKPKRAQGAFMSDDEVEGVVNFIKQQSDEVTYNETILDDIQTATSFSNDDANDEYLEDAINLALEQGNASASMIQRRFRVGYNRAARLLESLEERGIVGPPNGSKPREVLMTKSEFEIMNSPDTLTYEEETQISSENHHDITPSYLNEASDIYNEDEDDEEDEDTTL